VLRSRNLADSLLGLGRCLVRRLRIPLALKICGLLAIVGARLAAGEQRQSEPVL